MTITATSSSVMLHSRRISSSIVSITLTSCMNHSTKEWRSSLIQSDILHAFFHDKMIGLHPLWHPLPAPLEHCQPYPLWPDLQQHSRHVLNPSISASEFVTPEALCSNVHEILLAITGVLLIAVIVFQVLLVGFAGFPPPSNCLTAYTSTIEANAIAISCSDHFLQSLALYTACMQ